MNRKERRLAAKQQPIFSRADAASITDLMDEARRKYRQGKGPQAEALCKQVLARVPTHVHSLNLIGIIAQSSGRFQLSLKMFTRAIASDPLNAACHYNIGSSYRTLNRRNEAIIHFKKAITLGLSEKNIEEFILQSPFVAACLDRLEKEDPLSRQTDDMFSATGLEAVADELFLQCAMESTILRGRTLEIFLSHLRFALLRFAAANAITPGTVSDKLLACLSSLAQQCFIKEYVYSQDEEETRQSIALRNMLVEQLNGTGQITPLMLAAVGAYFPLYQLPEAERILSHKWPAAVSEVIQQQLCEPLEEMRDRPAIPKITAINDSVSIHVMQQYEENPYPRWVVDPHTAAFTEANAQQQAAGTQPFSGEILIAGCGTGLHVSQVAHQYPKARILAIDISLPSLAYARRKIREAGLNNVEFAQADILRLGSIDRSFDRIEAVGVLHHMAEPEKGWGILLSLLRSGGEMRVGLYSETGRRSIVEARTLIADRGYLPTVDDIRKCRQEIFRSDDGRWKRITSSVDFYSVSGCRDLLFNVMEHRFTIPQISRFLIDHGLSLVSFEEDPNVIQLFQHQFPHAAMTDLKQWHAFELANPAARRYMYVFSVRKGR